MVSKPIRFCTHVQFMVEKPICCKMQTYEKRVIYFELNLEWTKATMGQEQVDSIESGIESQIDDLINPTSVTLTIEDTE